MKRKLVLGLVVAIFLFSMVAVTQSVLCQNITDGGFIQSDEFTPPQFDEVGHMFADLIPSSVPVELTLSLSVVVRDEDGIDAVIGSYKKDNDTIWRNTTMSFYAELPEQRYLYSARPLNFTLDADNRNVVWDVVYYASDTLGNWNKSEQGLVSYCFFPADEPSIPIAVMIGGAIVGVIVVIVVIGVWWLKRVEVKEDES